MLRFRLLHKLFLLLFICLITSFTIHGDSVDFGIVVKKTIKKINENYYEVAIHVRNGSQIDGVARYEAKLPITADFVKEMARDKSVNFRLAGRKVKMIWMHIQRNKTYSAKFKIKSKVKMGKLKMPGRFTGHLGDDQVHVKDPSALIQFNAE